MTPRNELHRSWEMTQLASTISETGTLSLRSIVLTVGWAAAW
jgi:hypothetical protein